MASLQRKKKQKMVWTAEEDKLLLQKVLAYRRENDVGVDEAISWSAIAPAFNGSKSSEDCAGRIVEIHSAGNYFATIGEVWNPDSIRSSIKALDDWGSCKDRVCRSGAPIFDSRRLERDNREAKEFVSAMNGALLDAAAVAESITTVNDYLIPVDIFGKTIVAAEKAHLLPKARDDAITWQYPGCAVLGLDIKKSVGTGVAEKVVLGCTDSTKNPAKNTPVFEICFAILCACQTKGLCLTSTLTF